MTYRGHIRNGLITLDERAELPEGAEVSVHIMNEDSADGQMQPDRRQILRMPLDERRRRLMQQSERLVDFYAADPERTDWQGGDILE